MVSVLCVDDDIMFRNLVSSILSYSSEFELHLATGGEDGVMLALKNHYDIILMDIMMPDMDGWKATNIIRSTKPDSIIVSLSALDLRLLDSNCVFSDYIRKPVKSFEFKKTLKGIAVRYGLI